MPPPGKYQLSSLTIYSHNHKIWKQTEICFLTFSKRFLHSNVSTETHYLCRNFMRDSFNYFVIINIPQRSTVPRNKQFFMLSIQQHFFSPCLLPATILIAEQNKNKRVIVMTSPRRVETKELRLHRSWMSGNMPSIADGLQFCCFHLAERKKCVP